MSEEVEVAAEVEAGPSEPGRAGFLRVLRRRWRQADELGSQVVEWAVLTMGVALFAGLMVSILTGGAVKSALTDLVKRALSVH